MIKNFIRSLFGKQKDKNHSVPKVDKVGVGHSGPGSHQAGRLESMRGPDGKINDAVKEGIERGKVK